MLTGTARHSPMVARSRCTRQVGVLQCIPTWLSVKGFAKVPHILLPGRGARCPAPCRAYIVGVLVGWSYRNIGSTSWVLTGFGHKLAKGGLTMPVRAAGRVSSCMRSDWRMLVLTTSYPRSKIRGASAA